MIKSLPTKILTTLFLFIFIFIFQLAGLLFLALAPSAAQAADPAVFKPQVEIPGLKEEFIKDSKTGGYILPSDTGGIAKYIRAIYKYAIGVVGILAAVVLMIGGVMWIIAGGSATMIGEAKAWIGASLTGLTLALLSYLILATVNPALVELRTTTIEKVAPITECNKITSEESCRISVGCIWTNGACSKNTNPDQIEKCGPAANEMTGSIRCCTDRYNTANNNYKYARISLNRSCPEICGNDWTTLNDNSDCRTNLGY